MSNEKYDAELLKKLESCKNASSWSDFISFLDDLDSTLKKFSANYIPHKLLLIKRLTHCLNHLLPPGVHLKAIETYSTIFQKLPRQSLIDNFSLYTVGLLKFSLKCTILVLSDYLDLIEKFIIPLGSSIEPFSKDVILSLLPPLDTESSEHFTRAYLILSSFNNSISKKLFFDSLFLIFSEYPSLRISIWNYLLKSKILFVTDYKIFSNAFCRGFESLNPFIIRHTMDVTNRDFPMNIDGSNRIFLHEINSRKNEENLNAADMSAEILIGEDSHENNNELYHDVKTPAEGGLDLNRNPIEKELMNKLNNKSAESLYSETTVAPEMETKNIIVKEYKPIEYSEITSENIEEIKNEMLPYNRMLIKSFLSIFLKKEASMNKRAYKWLNINDYVTERDLDYIEWGLRGYLYGTEEETTIFFKILFSLADKEGLITSLMSRLLIEALTRVYELENKDPEICKKISKWVNMIGIDDIWQIFYLKLKDSLENKDKNENSEDQNVKEEFYKAKKKPTPEDIIKMICFAVKRFDIVDGQTKTIHLPAIGVLVAKNKLDIEEISFKDFMMILISTAEMDNGEDLVKSEQLDHAYLNESLNEISNCNIIAKISSEMSNIKNYSHKDSNLMEFKNCELFEIDGICAYKDFCMCGNEDFEIIEEKEVISDFSRISIKEELHEDGLKERNIYFSHNELFVLQKFFFKFGITHFEDNFIDQLSKFLIKNYKYKKLIQILGEKIDQNLLLDQIWNDYLKYDIPCYLFQYDMAEYTIKKSPYVSRNKIFGLLQTCLNFHKFHDFVFYFSGTTERKSVEFVNLINGINNPVPLLIYLLNKFSEASTRAENYYYVDSPDFNTLKCILMLFKSLLRNYIARKVLLENQEIDMIEYGKIGILQAYTNLLYHILVTKYEDYNETFDIKLKAESTSNLSNVDKNDEKGSLTVNIKPRDRIGFDIYDISTKEENTDLDDVTVKNFNTNNEYSLSANCLELRKIALSLMYTLNKNSIPIRYSNLSPIRDFVEKNKYDYLVVRNSLFLLKKDIEFIIKYCLIHFKEVFDDLFTIGMGSSFFQKFLESKEDMTFEMVELLYKHLKKIDVFPWHLYYQKSIKAMTLECKRNIIKYQQIKEGYFMAEPHSIINSIANNKKTCKSIHSYFYKTFLSIQDASEIFDELSNDLYIYQREMSSIETFAFTIYYNDPILFADLIFKEPNSSCLFFTLKFKKDLFKNLLSYVKNSINDIDQLIKFSRALSVFSRAEIFASEIEFFKTNFFYSKLEDSNKYLFFLEFIKGVSCDNLIRAILADILRKVETQIAGSVRFERELEVEMVILEKIMELDFKDQNLVLSFKNCVFGLLNIKKYRSNAVDIISIILNSPNKIFAAEFMNHFKNNFFTFEIEKKYEIMRKIFSYSIIEQNSILMEYLNITGTSSSYFASINNQTKLDALKRIAFLIFASEKNTLAELVDELIFVISRLLNSPPLVKVAIYNLCSIMLFRVKHKKMESLFPMLFEDIIKSLEMKDFKLSFAVLRFLDLWIWLKAGNYDFDVLLLKENDYSKAIRLQFGVEKVLENVDISNMKLNGKYPNFFRNITTKEDITNYISRVKSYYEQIDRTFIQRDEKIVEKDLLLTSFEE